MLTREILPSDLDNAIVFYTWTATLFTLFVAAVIHRCYSYFNRTRSFLITLLLATSYVFAIFLVSSSINTTIVQLLQLLLLRVFDETPHRYALILFWTICAISSLLYVFMINTVQRNQKHVDTTERKFFHLSVSLVAITGLLYDPEFTRLCAHLVLQAFITIEMFRCLDIRPLSHYLNNHLLIFLVRCFPYMRFKTQEIIL
jgi:uncharacterized membrane protein (DUF441 family)